MQIHNRKENFLSRLFDCLWVRYRQKMEYVRKYERMVQSHRAQFTNDHVAFRTIALQKPMSGFFTISRIFEALGYVPAACYEFRDKHLSSIHYQHPNPDFPKIFITQLKSWELSTANLSRILRVLKTHRPPITDKILRQLTGLESNGSRHENSLLRLAENYFRELPWELPQKEDLIELDKETQFGAWVLVNGYDVNHFTASVDSHGVPSLDDIEKVVEEMRKCGIPMKKEIEGERGSKLRQSATDAVILDTAVKDGKQQITIPWTYAYFEIAQRPLLKNPVTGKLERFQGFLGGQATNLFDMTKYKK